MIDTETVFILGSGASQPYNFPTDYDLRMRIIKDFKNDYPKMPYTSDFSLRFLQFEKNRRSDDAEKFILRLLHTEGTATIDEFISINNQFEDIGKIAIQHYLLEYERNYLKSRSDNYVSDWFEIVLNKMLKECKDKIDPSAMDFNKVTFLTFNYDRLIEYLFIKQFINLFQEHLNDDINKHQIEFFIYKIIHIYGSLGFLPSKEDVLNPREVKFGELIETYERIKETLTNIRLIKNGFNDPKRISKKLFCAKNIFFLGVG